jgi:hypothetical protein
MCTVLLPPGGYPTAVNKYIVYNMEKPRCKLEGNIKMNLKEMSFEGVDWDLRDSGE